MSFETLLVSLNTRQVMVFRPTQHWPAIYFTVVPLPCNVPWLHDHSYPKLSPVATTVMLAVSIQALSTVSVAVRLTIFIAPVSAGWSFSLAQENTSSDIKKITARNGTWMSFLYFIFSELNLKLAWI